jgi:hypothetical protein
MYIYIYKYEYKYFSREDEKLKEEKGMCVIMYLSWV